MGRRICFVGYAPSSRDWGNEQDDDVEIWTITEAAKFLLRVDRYFQTHPRDWKDEERHAEAKELGKVFTSPNSFGRGPEALHLMRNLKVPIYMNFPEDEFPTSVKFPMDEIKQYGKEWFGEWYEYLTSTIAYMAALALLEHDKGDTVDEVLLAGIELSVGTEYYHQRPCFEYYLGYMRGRGIKVTLPPGEKYRSSILGAPTYPLDDPLPKPKDFVSNPAPVYVRSDIIPDIQDREDAES